MTPFARSLLLAGALILTLPSSLVVPAAAAPACTAAGTSLADCSFESIVVSGYAYNPTGGPWTFADTSGIAANNSIFTSGNPPAPDGVQVAFVQNTGQVSQTISGFAAGTYTLSFSAAGRANFGGQQALEVLLDSQPLGQLLLGQTSWQTFSVSFTTTDGAHLLTFAGLHGGDNTAFIDLVSLAPGSLPQDCADAAGTTLSQCGFETPQLGPGNFTGQAFLGSAWTFSGMSGLSGNGSTFTAGNPPAPEGSQVAVLQQHSSISQAVSGFADGTTYTLTFSAAGRANFGGQQDIQVLLDSTQLLPRLLLTQTTYQTFSVSFQPGAGSHTMAFVGLDSAGGDNTAFLDDLHLVASVVLRPTSLSYNGQTSFDAGQPGQLSATLVDGSGQPVAGRTLSFSLGGSQSCSAQTDAFGNAACAIDVVNQPAGLNNVGVAVSFAGDSAFLPSQASVNASVFHATALTYTGPAGADFHDPFTASAQLLDVSSAPPSATPNLSVSFALGSSSCQATTDATGVATCVINPGDAAGAHTLTATFPATGALLGSSASAGFQIGFEETTLVSTSAATAVSGSVQLSARLTEDGSAPIAGRSLTFTLGSSSCSATTSAAGSGTCSVDSSALPLGPTALAVAFAGDGFYAPARAGGQVLLYALPSGGVFVVGDLADPNNAVFYSSQWSQSNPMTGGPGPADFKGFAQSATALAPGGTFTATPGNSTPPPSTLPSYMGVVVTGSVTESDISITGSVERVAIVHVSGYAATVGGNGHGALIS